ncbi:hypothetical protein LCGC14_1642420 [marine sediment metagenome]|uniref:Uncharacterized protein n=1 Tax=marine sediment metagenome TaxID=412755 RepID=A0A0F9KF13_9ZZZZ
MTGHTQEKWTFNELAGDDSRGMGYVNDGSEDIAHVGVMGYSTQQNLKLAHLIAAAPETAAERDRLKTLNEELLTLMAATDIQYRGCEYPSTCGEEWTCTPCRFRAAIAKAQPEKVPA